VDALASLTAALADRYAIEREIGRGGSEAEQPRPSPAEPRINADWNRSARKTCYFFGQTTP
jgi:hypothetical protein